MKNVFQGFLFRFYCRYARAFKFNFVELSTKRSTWFFQPHPSVFIARQRVIECTVFLNESSYFGCRKNWFVIVIITELREKCSHYFVNEFRFGFVFIENCDFKLIIIIIIIPVKYIRKRTYVRIGGYIRECNFIPVVRKYCLRGTFGGVRNLSVFV